MTTSFSVKRGRGCAPAVISTTPIATVLPVTHSPVCPPRDFNRSKRLHSRHRSFSLDSSDSPLHYHSGEDLSLLDGAVSQPLLPVVPSPADGRYNSLFGSDSEDDAYSPRQFSVPRGNQPLSTPRTSFSGSDHPQPSEPTSPRLPGLTYFHVTPNLQISDSALQIQGLPTLSQDAVHLTKSHGCHIITLPNPTDYPTLEYNDQVRRLGTQKDPSLSHRNYIRVLNRFIQTGGVHHLGFTWHVEDHQSEDGAFSFE